MSPPTFWAIAVADLGLADWYAQAFGLTRVAHMDPAADGSRVVVLRGLELMIELKQRPSHVDRVDAADGYFKVGWFVPSLGRATDDLIDTGAELLTPPVEQRELGIRFCIVGDPEGNLIQLFEEL